MSVMQSGPAFDPQIPCQLPQPLSHVAQRCPPLHVALGAFAPAVARQFVAPIAVKVQPTPHAATECTINACVVGHDVPTLPMPYSSVLHEAPALSQILMSWERFMMN